MNLPKDLPSKLFALCATLSLTGCMLQPAVVGRVSDAQDRPVSGVQVALEAADAGGDQPVSTGQTDANGEFRLKDPATGRYRLRVDWEYDVACPGLEAGLPLTRIDDFKLSYDGGDFRHMMVAVKEFDYLHGVGARLDFRVPCQRATPAPTLRPSDTPLPTETPAPTATRTPKPSLTPRVGPTPRVSATAMGGSGGQEGCPALLPGTDESLAGSTWLVTFDSGESFNITLLPGGTLETDASTLSECADWRQAGDTVYIRLRADTLELQGQLSGDTMQGVGDDLNTMLEWSWTGVRVP